jgi:hypothetical protein
MHSWVSLARGHVSFSSLALILKRIDPLWHFPSCCRLLVFQLALILNGQVFVEYTKVDEIQGSVLCHDSDLRIMGGTIIKLFHFQHQKYLGCVNDESTAFELSDVGLIADNDIDSESYDMRSCACCLYFTLHLSGSNLQHLNRLKLMDTISAGHCGASTISWTQDFRVVHFPCKARFHCVTT